MPRAVIVSVFLAVVLAASTAGPHAFLDRAEPAVGATVATAPARVRVWFTGALEPSYSRVEVLNEAGKRVDAGDSHVDPDNRALLSVSLPALPAGLYKVAWRVLSVDTHLTEGDFTFRVRS